ncbi:MAG: transcriptional regulator [Planctomycetes bacterium]|nr:transcriptional regulator [Planctomycetota bacterium]
MKFLLIAYDEANDRDVLKVLADAGVQNYTKWLNVQGKGASSGPHLGTPVWPKQNHVLAVAVEDHQASQILQGVRRLRETLLLKGVKAFLLPLEDLTSY